MKGVSYQDREVLLCIKSSAFHKVKNRPKETGPSCLVRVRLLRTSFNRSMSILTLKQVENHSMEVIPRP